MATEDKKQKPTSPLFIRAYLFVLQDSTLTPAEKLVLLTVCRYRPKPCWHTNLQIAGICGFSERYVERLLRRLKDKNRIKTGYVHKQKNGKLHTVRVIVPSETASQHTDQSVGTDTDQSVATYRPIGAKHTDQSVDLLELKRKGIESATDSTSANKPNLPLEKRREIADRGGLAEKLNLRRTPAVKLSKAEFERRRQKQQASLGAR